MKGKLYPSLKTIYCSNIGFIPRSFIALVFSFLAIQVSAKTVVVGSGSGQLNITSMSGYSAGDVLAIAPGTYSGGQLTNLNGVTFINNGGLVTFTSRINVSGLTNVIFSGTGASGITNGFVFQGPSNASQQDQGDNTVGGGFHLYGHCEGFRIYNADVVGNTNLIDASQAATTYDGNTSNIGLYKTTIANVHMIHTSYLVVGSFKSVTSFYSVIDSIDIHNLTCDTSLTDNKIVWGNGVFRANFYDWNVHNAPVYPFLDQGIVHISGNGRFHHIYVNGGWGYIVRCFASSLGSTVQDVWVYNCIKLNTVKYGLCDIEMQPSDMTSSGVGTTGTNIHVINNTEGNCTDYNDASHQNPWYTPIYLTPSLLSGYTIEVKNNVGFNMPTFNYSSTPTSAIINFTSVALTNASNNPYYSTASAAGFADQNLCMLSSGSPLIDAGTTVSAVTDDISHISRPQGSAYDVGAREYNKGSSSTNQPPVANAGAKQIIVLPANSVTLDGSGSSDPDGTISTFAWSQTSGPSVATITNTGAYSTSVTGLIQGTYVFQLTVTDNSGASANASVTIVVNAATNQSPVANAGSNQTIILPTSTATLDGSSSKDPDGTIASYAWSQVSGPSNSTLSNKTTSKATASGLVQGTYVFVLKVTDNSGATASDSTTVTVNAGANQSPVANAGTSQSITLPANSVTLDGSKSSDPDGTIASYAWTQVSGPSTATMSKKTTAAPTMSALVAGTYVFQLTVTDNSGATATAQVKITVSPAANQSPVANAGSNQTITLPINSVTLDGSNSADPDGTIASYAWTQLSGPSTATVAAASSASTAVNNLVQGNYVFQLTVTDNSGATATDQVSVAVNAAVNQAPVANAGAAKTITLPTNSITLDGSASKDPDGTIASYAWSQVSGPSTATMNKSTSAAPTISNLVAGTYMFQLKVTDNSGATATAQVKIVVNPAANQAPSANAGSNQTITLPINSVTLDGSSSGDPDGTIASYAWTKVSGPTSGTISSATASTTTVTGLVAGTYVYQLTVTDNSGATATDQVTITVNAAPNQAPVANAGTAKSIMLPTNSITLDGSKSSDPDGTIASYAWSQVSGPTTATMSKSTTAAPTMSNLVAGTYVFQLKVTDNSGATATAQVKITVNPAANQAPSANAGSNQTITLPINSVTLDGSSSADPDGTIASYAWTKVSGPNSGTITSAAASTTTVTGLVAGTYVYQLTVTDNSGATATDQVTITVNAAPNQAPVANAGTAKSITLPTNSVTLDGSKSSDPDGTIASYAWSQVSGPGTATMSKSTTAAPTMSNLVAGTYVFQLKVTDNDGATATAQVKISVGAAPNQAPSANAGSNQTITLPTNSVTLDGSSSGDPDGTIASYAWTKVSGPGSGNITSAAASTTTVTGLVAGTYVYQLTVTDNSGATATDQVTITVNAAPNQSPVANAGTAKSIILPTNSITLDGSKSSDPDGTIASYAWSQVSGPGTATMSKSTTAAPTMSNLVAGTYVFQLKVTDNDGATATAQVKISVGAAPNQAPSANAGSNQTITLPTNSVTLDGTNSADPDGTISLYGWTKVSGPASGAITSATAPTTTVTGLVEGTYVYQLTVTDNSGATATDQVTITVNPAPNQAPVANAGTSKSITLPTNSVSLDGSRSSDPDGTIASYAWSEVSGPSTATISGRTTSTPTVNNLIAGQYIFLLTVKDNDGATATAQVKITVSAAANVAPTANAGSNQTITLPTNSILLDGSGSQKGTGAITGYAWTKVSGPAGSTIVNASSVTTQANNLVAGTYVFKLTVTDANSMTDADSVTIIVNPAPNQAPVANAGTIKTITLPTNLITLDGSKSSDPDGTIASYAWTQVSGPSTATLTGRATAAPTAGNLKAGQYIFQLTVTDNDGATATAQVKVTVNPAANQPPSASAGSNQNITLPVNTVTLDGTSSSDPDGTIAAYAWSQASGPSTATIATASGATTTVNGLVEGAYVFQLTVTDNSGATATDQVTVVVNPAPNQAPVANAGNNRNIMLPTSSLTLSGSRSSDPDGTIAAYNWVQVSGPTTATITNGNTVAATVSGLKAGQYIFQLTVTDNDGATDNAQVKVTVIAAANQPPSANAGSNQNITLPINTVTLDGTASSDPDGTIAGYAWSQASGPSTATIVNANGATTIANGLAEGTYVFQLTVTDNSGATATDQVTVVVNPAPNQAPVANAGNNRNIMLPTSSLTLSGSRSSDPDGTITAYNWVQVSGPTTAAIANGNTVAATVSGLKAGQYIFQLTVTDNDGATDDAQVKVTVIAAANQPPVANAGSSVTITLPVNTVTLDGSNSGDPDGTIAGYAWIQESGPSTATIANAGGVTTTVNGLAEGTYVFQLTVTDNSGATATDEVTVTVNAAPNQPPVANAGNNRFIMLPANSLTLSGSRSSDADGTIAAYNWIQVSGPATATITNDNTVAATVSGLKAGQYIFQLTVTDNDGATDNAQVKVTVIAAANQPPVANAGSSVTITLPLNTVTLDGSNSADPDGTISGYTWTQESGPSTATVVNAGGATTAVNALVAGTYVFQLTVTDNNGATGTDEITVTVNAAPNRAPVANAGNNRYIMLPNNSTTLDGSNSADPDGTIASYSWTQVSGPAASTLANDNSARATASDLVAGQYIFQLTVVDNSGASATAQVKITVIAAANQSPVANAGATQTITLPVNSVVLNGSLSNDPDGTIASYTWTELSGPITISFNNSNGDSTTVNGFNQAGTYIFSLVVTDNKGATGTDYVRVVVKQAPNQAPVANIGATQTITLPLNTVTLDGTQSTDADGTIASYTWTEISGPTAATLSAGDSSVTKASGLQQGQYVFELDVVDNDGAIGKAQTKIVVVPAPNQYPFANAGADRTINLPTNTIALDGTKSYDPDGTIASYSWKKISGPGAISITNSNTATPTAVGLVAGTYVFQLTVADKQGLTDDDQVTVVVNPPKNQAPVANAGPDKSITLPINSVTVNGSASSDPDGTIASYLWEVVSGPGPATITSATSATTSITDLVAGVYVFSLTVTDNSGAKSIDQVIIIVNAATLNVLPVADAGKDTTIAVPATEAMLDGSGSSDANGLITAYLWTQVSGPSAATIGTPSGTVSSVTNLIPGVYVFQLTVSDSHGNSANSTVKVTVVNNFRSLEQVTIYPNPATTTANLRIISDTTGTVVVNMFDMAGRLVKTIQMDKPSSYLESPINVSNLAGGMYTLQIRIGNRKTMIAKLIKQ